MDGDDIVCIARNGGNRAMNNGYMLGSRVQAQVTAAGLLMMTLCKPDWQEWWLAIHELKAYTSFTNASKDRVSIELARIRTQGWAISEQPLGLNHRRIAVPLRDRHGEVAGLLSMTIPMGYKSSEDAVARVCPCCARPLKPCAT